MGIGRNTTYTTSLRTLRFLNLRFHHKSLHPSLSNIENARQVSRGLIKLRLITGTYTLQSNQQTFGKSLTDICQLCGDDTEDTIHFVVNCSYLAPTRSEYLRFINNEVPYVYAHRSTIFNSPPLLTHLLLDPLHPNIHSLLPLSIQTRATIELLSRDLIYKLHLARADILNRKLRKGRASS